MLFQYLLAVEQIYNCTEKMIEGQDDEFCVIDNQYNIEPYVSHLNSMTSRSARS